MGIVRSSRPSAIVLPLAFMVICAALAHAAAIVFEIDDQRDLALRQRVLGGECRAIGAEEIVDEGRLAVAQIEPVAALEPAMRDDHALRLVVGKFDLGGDRPRLVAHRRRGRVGQADRARIIGHRRPMADQARAPHRLGVHANGWLANRAEARCISRPRPTTDPEARAASADISRRDRWLARNLRRSCKAPTPPCPGPIRRRFGSHGTNEGADAIQPS